MKQRAHARLLLLLAGVIAVGCTESSGREVPPATDKPGVSEKTVALREGMRKLWADHVIWTRQYIVSAVGNDASAKQALDRLMKNQEDIGDAIKPYYGDSAGTKLTTLLKTHISQAGEVVAAARAGNKAKLDDANKRWHENAAEIASFLSGANPNWTNDDLKSMLNDHLAVTTDEAVARIERKWDDDVHAFDKIFDQAMHMADALADGIMKQFPTKV